MIGFELITKEKNISAAVEQGVVTIVLTKLNNELDNYIYLDCSGLRKFGEKEQKIVWNSTPLNIGDEITIKVKQIEKTSPPIESTEREPESINEKKLKNYYALKKELEDKGLI
ncbi:hypothetical protein [Ornithobacterium rhinotracheale]|uniref:hypothetical protein n=1 Tax=Ornithobacterium rhinotracheale TaxID=28251 RepID=UPI001FF1C5AF|nr:hypothetical protein [Ornithobacterium rhinotracheale]MCK0205084.1 hypothetical protein [Ornithobacterium rhinotracheale]